MKTKIFILLLLNVLFVYGQEPILFFDAWHLDINFEDTSEYKYLSIDTNKVWIITKPQKNILFLPTTLPELGEKAIISDTNQYYKKNLRTSFQFKLYLESSFDYSIFSRYKYDLDKNKDGGIIETSYDNGETWKNILFDDRIMNSSVSKVFGLLYDINDTILSYNNQPGFTGFHPELGHFEIYFRYFGDGDADTMLLRFTLSSDSIESQNEGWMLDDIRFFKTLADRIYSHGGKMPVLKIFPNPTLGIIYITSDIEEIAQIQILSLTGTVLFQENDKNVIQINNLKPGLYFIRINNRYLSKIVKY
jgi:hypothetical protein